jgi:hypothetical protein
MTANEIVADARVLKVRELKTALEKASARAAKAEAELEALKAHFDLALVALADFSAMEAHGKMLIVDGWNAVLKERNTSRLPPEEVKRLKMAMLERVRASVAGGEFARAWVVFDGHDENSFADGALRISYTGGSGLHRADRLIFDFAHCAFLLGLDVTRLTVETSDKDLNRRLAGLGVALA